MTLKNEWKGQSIDLLKALHLLTREGALNADARRKLKQVHHLVQFIEPILQDSKNTPRDRAHGIHIVDVGSGKSYLGFILYDLILRQWDSGWITSIESREALVRSAQELATKSGFDRMHFVHSKIEDQTTVLQKSVDVLCALHACDTATDDAIQMAIANDIPNLILVPCCQAEVARQLEAVLKHTDPETKITEGLYRFPLHRREFGSHLTNVIRSLLLETLGYQVTVTELTGWEHSMKNELIIARKTKQPNLRSRDQLRDLLQRFPVRPKALAQYLNHL